MLYMPPGPSQRAVIFHDGASCHKHVGLSVFLCSKYISVKGKPALEIGYFGPH